MVLGEGMGGVWPGSDLPVGPLPHQPAPHQPPPHQAPLARPEPPPIRPAGGWYALPGSVLVGAALLVIVVIAFNFGGMERADGPQASGDAREGIKIELTGDHNYYLFVPNGSSMPTGCAVAPADGEAVPVQLTRAESWNATPPSGHRHAATFRAPFSGSADLTCKGAPERMEVVPSDIAYGYIALAVIGAVSLGVVGGAILIMILMLRTNSAKRHRAAMETPAVMYPGY
jgi:hypothetical protein